MTMVLKAMTYFFRFFDFYRNQDKDLEPTLRALVYTTHSDHQDDKFDGLEMDENTIVGKIFKLFDIRFNPLKVYWGMPNSVEEAAVVENALKLLLNSILLVGLYFQWTRKLIDPTLLLVVCFVVNTLVQIPDLFLLQSRKGIDYDAYLNQAGQVVNGQRNYR